MSRPNERVIYTKISFSAVDHLKYKGYCICPALTMKSSVKQKVSKLLLLASSCYQGKGKKRS